MPHTFFTHVVPTLLTKLKEEQTPAWGQLSATGMVDHLRVALAFSMQEEQAEIVVPEEKLVVYKRFLMSEKPFTENLRQPEAFARVASFDGDFESQKQALLQQLEEVLQHYDTHPDFTANHPSFGTLSVYEWLHLHKKHISHHFRQFGLL